MALPASFTGTQVRMTEYCQWVKDNVETNWPSFREQNARIQEYMGKMQEYWNFSADSWQPQGVEDVSTLARWVQDEEYYSQFTGGQENVQYMTIADNVPRMNPASEDSEYSVAEQLINRNEWFNRSIVCIGAGAVTALAGVFTTEVVLLAGVVAAVFGAVMAVTTFVAYLGVEFDLDYHNAIAEAIEARGNGAVEALPPPPPSHGAPLQVPRGAQVGSQVQRTTTRDVRADLFQRAVLAEAARPFVFKDTAYNSRGGRHLALAYMPSSSERLKEELTPAVIKLLGNQYVRQALSTLRFNGQRTEDYNWLQEQVSAHHPKGAKLVREAGNRDERHAWCVPTQDNFEAYSAS